MPTEQANDGGKPFGRVNYKSMGFDKGVKLYNDGIPLCISGCRKQAKFCRSYADTAEADYFDGMADGFQSCYPKEKPVHPTGECWQPDEHPDPEVQDYLDGHP